MRHVSFLSNITIRLLDERQGNPVGIVMIDKRTSNCKLSYMIDILRLVDVIRNKNRRYRFSVRPGRDGARQNISELLISSIFDFETRINQYGMTYSFSIER